MRRAKLGRPPKPKGTLPRLKPVRPSMTPERLSACLIDQAITERGLAYLTGYSPTMIRHWITGRLKVPLPIGDWLERRVADPPPPRIARKPGRKPGRKRIPRPVKAEAEAEAA